MKKSILFLFVILSYNIYSQEHVKPIHFDDIQPKWQHLVVDSSRLNDEIYKGTKHLRPFRKNIINGDTVGYFVYVDGSEHFQGAYIEKIDLTSGTVLWHNVFGLSDTGAREYPVYVYLNEKGKLEIISMRNIQKDFVWIWGLGQISIRKYDIMTGELIEHLYNKDTLKNDEKLNFYPEQIRMYPLNGNYVYITPYLPPLFTTYIKIFNSKTNLESIDSLKRDSLYISGSSYGPFLQNNETLIYSRHSFNQSVFEPIKDENYDSMRFFIDYYTLDFDFIKSIELSDYFPYNWQISLNQDNDNLVFICKDSSSFFRTYTAYVFFDDNGKYLETIDLKRKSDKNILIKKLPKQKGVLVFETHNNSGEDNKYIDVFRSNGHGNLELLKKLTFKEKRIVNVNHISILKNNTILLELTLWVQDPDKPQGASLTKIIDLIAFDSEELGLVGTQEEPVKKERFFIYPNPTKENIKIKVLSSFNGTIEIYDAQGRIVEIIKVENSNTKKIDVSGLSKGVYYIKAIDKNRKLLFKTESFVVE